LVPLREFDGNMTLEEFTDFSDDLENSKEINIEVPVFSMDEETLDVKEYNDYEQWGFK
jgi:serine protease inhibitor